MSSIAEQLMEQVFARLLAAPVIEATERIRRHHLTITIREQSPTVNLEMGDDRKVGMSSCAEKHVLDFAVCILVRSDETHAAADPVLLAVLAALNPNQGPGYSHSALLTLRMVRRPQPEIADLDALETRVELEFAYTCAPWALDQPA